MQALAPRLAGARPTASGIVYGGRCTICVPKRVSAPSESLSQTGHCVQRTTGRKDFQPTQRFYGRLSSQPSAAAVTADMGTEEVGVSDAADAVIRYAINLARAAETYQVHSWMVLLGILKYETCTAAQILKKLGLEDLYGAWNEVLWALHVCDGLKPRSFTTEVTFADRAMKVVTAASDFAQWHGKDKMYSEDLLMALAAGGVLEGLFPNLNLSFDSVRKAVEKQSGRRYILPDETEEQGGPLKSEDEVFL